MIANFIETLQQWSDQPTLVATGVVVISLILGRLTEWVLTRLFGAFAKRTKTAVDDQVIEALRRPIFLSVVFVGLVVAAEILALPPSGRYAVHGVVGTLAVLTWSGGAFRIAGALLTDLGRRATANSIVQPRTVPLFDMLARVAVVGTAIYFLFLSWDVDVTAWLASAGIIGIAVGFAAKDTLSNFFSGVFILADAPYKLGDYIVLDDGLRGKVTSVGIRSTRILTRDDVEITIPNALIGNSKIVNENGGPRVSSRLRVKVSVAYGSDVDQVRAILLSLAKGEHICKDPEPRVRFRRFGDSGLEIELLVWIDEAEARGRVLDALNTTIYKTFAKKGIEIPYSKHDVYIKEMPEAVRKS